MWNFWPSNTEWAIAAVVVGLIGWGVIEIIRWAASYVHIAIG